MEMFGLGDMAEKAETSLLSFSHHVKKKFNMKDIKKY